MTIRQTRVYCLWCLEPSREDPCVFCGTTRAEALRTHPPFLPPGTLLDGRYLVGSTLRHNVTDVVYIGRHLKLDCKVMIREYLPRGFANRHKMTGHVLPYEEEEEGFSFGLEAFSEEARSLAALKGHPNVMAVENGFEANSTAYLVMHYFEGELLEERITHSGNSFSQQEAYVMLIQLLHALRAVHEANLIQGNIDSQTVYVTDEGQVKLIDLGTTEQRTAKWCRSRNSEPGQDDEPNDQHCGAGDELGPWTDVYGAGALAYELMTGERPAETVERQTGDAKMLTLEEATSNRVSRTFSDAIMKAIAVKAEDRFQSVEAFQAALHGDSHTADTSEHSKKDASSAQQLGTNAQSKPEKAVSDSALQSLGASSPSTSAHGAARAQEKAARETNAKQEAVSDGAGLRHKWLTLAVVGLLALATILAAAAVYFAYRPGTDRAKSKSGTKERDTVSEERQEPPSPPEEQEELQRPILFRRSIGNAKEKRSGCNAK